MQKAREGCNAWLPLQLLLYSPVLPSVVAFSGTALVPWVPMKCDEKSIGEERRCEVTWLTFF